MAYKRYFLQLVLLGAGVFLMLSFADARFADDPIRLGVVGVYSGELAPFGLSGLRGAQLAVEVINNKGGILGRRIKLFVEDDNCKPIRAATKAAKMVAEDVIAVIGHTCSGATQAALEIYTDANIIVISPSATNPALTQSGNHPNFMRTIAPDNAQAKNQVDFALERLGSHKIAVIHDRGVYGKGLAEAVKRLVEKSARAEVVLYAGLSPASVTYAEMATKIKLSKADTVIFGGYHPGAVQIISHLRRMKLNTAFISGDGIKDDSFIAGAGAYAEGVYATAPKDTSKLPQSVAALDAYRKTFQSEPGPFFLNAYAATLALVNAVEKAGTTDYTAVLKMLKTEFVQTPLGKIGFDRKGDPKGVGFSVYQVRNGVFIEQ
ncbi:MAG: branched-chain amino acid ABC transporter substrate-binding protein [Desulfobacteraceae bacterium]|jgi:branched-chain amino acid transport system substrate-binding protein